MTLTLDTSLQAVARTAIGKTDGAAVALDPKTGAVLAMYSNPNYNPVPLTSPSFDVETAARRLDNKPDGNGFAPFNSVATGETFPPGSTFKVITTAAAVVSKPADLTKDFESDRGACTTLPDSDKLLCNSGGLPCGGDVEEMLPPSCDPGYALLGLDLGADYMFKAATSFGYDAIPPLDLPGTHRVTSRRRHRSRTTFPFWRTPRSVRGTCAPRHCKTRWSPRPSATAASR